MTTQRRVMLACLLAAYCFMMGTLVGVLTERIRFDHRRAVVLEEYDSLSARMRDHLMAIEKVVTRHAATDR